MTNTTDPTIMGGSLSSGINFFALFSLGWKIVLVSQVMYAQAESTPMKMARNGSEDTPKSIPLSNSKLMG